MASKFIFENNTFAHCNVGISIDLPAEWDVTVEARSNNFIRTGTAFEFRGEKIEIPKEIAATAVDAYKRAIEHGSQPEQAVASVSEVSAVKRFLQSKGIESAGLLVATGQLLAQIFGISG